MVQLPQLVNPLAVSIAGPIVSAPVVVKLKVPPPTDPARLLTLLFSVRLEVPKPVCTLRLVAVIVLPAVCEILLLATRASHRGSRSNASIRPQP